MKLYTKTLMFVGLLAAPFVVSAAVEQGMAEVDFTGAYASFDVEDEDIDVGLLAGTFGYFVTDAIETSVGGGYLTADLEDEDIDAFLLNAAVDFHFNTAGAVVPFVGGGLYWASVDNGDSDDDWAWEVRAGIKQFVAENVAIRYSVSYLEFSDVELDGLVAGVGLSVFF